MQGHDTDEARLDFADASAAEAPHAEAGDDAASSEVRRTSVKDRLAEPDSNVTGGVGERMGDDAQTVVATSPAGTEVTDADEVATAVVRADAHDDPADDDAGDTAQTEVVAAPGVAASTKAHGTKPKKPTKRKKRRAVKAGIWTLAVLVVLGGLYVASVLFLADRVPADTTVAGVDISGLSVADARERLDAELGVAESTPLPLTFEGVSTEIEPGSAGLSFDSEATVAQFTGFTWDPRVLLGHVFGLGEQEPVTHADADALTVALESLAQDLNVAPIEGVIELTDDGDVAITEPENGVAVDVQGAATLVAEEWLTGSRPVALPTTEVEPEVGPAQIAAVQAEIIDPLFSGPVTVAVNDTEVELTVEEIVSAATLEGSGAAYTLSLDGEELADTVTAKEDSIGESARSARIELRDGRPAIIPAVTGTGLDPAELGVAVHDAALQTGADERVAEVELTQTEAEFTTADAEALGVVEVISEFSTPFHYDPPRTANLREGARKLTNVLLLPGEEFSLLQTLGPFTAANGYYPAGVVVDGFFSEAMGGGLSQMSTTVFNAAFEAGLEDVTHTPHSRWFSRYPPGREATMFTPDLDMRFRNNTEHGVLIQSWVTDGRVFVRMWGTRTWDVRIVTGERYNITQPQTVYNQRPNCEPEPGGQVGFSIQYTRTVSRGGEVHDRRTYTHTYRPWNRVVCGPPPAPGSDDDGDNGNGGD